ncbi:MAG TPA: MMPL family transporter [Blastocatellia bacterium]|nr:MMPL family transporter [Blastocatellia bacterium]
MNRLGKLVVDHARFVIVATCATTVAFAAAIAVRGLSFNGSPETLARHDDTLAFFNETRRAFGDDRVIIAALTTEDVFTPGFLEKLDRLTRRLAAAPGVAETQSLTNIKAIRRDRDTVVIDKLIPGRLLYQPDAGTQLQTLKATITADPLYVKQFVSADGRTAAINVFLKPLGESASRAAAEAIERMLAAEAGADEVMLSGVPVIDARGIRSMLRDMLLLSPLAALLCFIVFFTSFRSFWGVALPMSALVIGLTWTLGLMALTGKPITLATLSLPTVLMAVGSSYIFHVLNQYRLSMTTLAGDSTTKRAAWLAGVEFIAPAVILSGLTTMAGFGALASSTVPTARDMGIFEAAGVGFMLLLTMAFIPAALTLLPADALASATPQRHDYAAWLNSLLRRITAWVLFRRRTVIFVTLLLTALIGAGAARLRVNTDYLRIFPQASATVQDALKLHERLAGAATVQVVVSGAAGAASSPPFLNAVAALERFALDQPGVDASISVADIVKRLNAVVNNSPGGEAIPQDAAALGNLFDNYLAEDPALLRLVSRDRSRAIVILRTNLFSSNALRELTDHLDAWSRANLPAGVTARATGSAVLLNSASDAIADSQLWSLAIAIGLIFVMMATLFRSPATGLLALLPNLLPIVCYFGFLGWAGITLDITTSLIASAVLGLAVDNAVHMIRRYRQCAAEQLSGNRDLSYEAAGWAMWLALLRTGKPMWLANVMLMAAFLVFVLSSFVPVRVGGLLWAVTILACLAADLVFLPALMKTRWFARAALPALRNQPGQEPARMGK